MEDDEEEEEPRYISFSGHGDGPEAYLRWETEMDSLFRFHNIPKEERLSQAVSSLVGEASTWWINDEARSYYYKPVTNWGNLKQRMYKEFVQRLHNRSYTPKRLMFQARPNPRERTSKAFCPNPKELLSNTHARRTTIATPVEPAKETHPPSRPYGVVPKGSPKPTLEPEGMETQGTEKTQQDHAPPKLIGDNNSEIGFFTKATTLLSKEVTNQPRRGIIASLLIKEEPPDSNYRTYPGYTQTLTRGNQVLRTKLFEGGGYDAVIQTIPKAELPKPTAVRCVPPDTVSNGGCKAKLQFMSTKHPSLGIHQTIHALEDCGRARTQLARSDLEMAHQGPSKAVAEDIHPLKGGHQPAQKNLGNETTWSTILTHQAITANLNQTKRSSHEEDIQLSSWVNLDLPDLDTRALNGGFQPNQEELRCKPNWSVILIQIGNYGSWIHTNPNSDVKVIQLSRQRIIHLPYLESHELMRHQTYPWHPGDLKMHLGASGHVLSCTSTQRIRRIHPHFNFPFPDVFTPCAFKEFAQQLLKYTQRLFGPDSCILDVIKAIQKVPRKLTYPSKPSRYKAPSTPSSSWPICSLCRLTASFALIA